MLCQNRVHLPGHPSTCALDIIIVPLPSIIALVAILVAFCTTLLRRGVQSQSTGSSLPKWLHVVYLVLVACAVGMSILEIVRLALDNQGVGLLPFNTVAFVFTFLAVLFRRHRALWSISIILPSYWLLLAIFQSVKVARLAKYAMLDPHKPSKYPSSDDLLDNAVLLGLIVVFMGLELLDFARRRHVASQNKA